MAQAQVSTSAQRYLLLLGRMSDILAETLQVKELHQPDNARLVMRRLHRMFRAGLRKANAMRQDKEDLWQIGLVMQLEHLDYLLAYGHLQPDQLLYSQLYEAYRQVWFWHHTLEMYVKGTAREESEDDEGSIRIEDSDQGNLFVY